MEKILVTGFKTPRGWPEDTSEAVVKNIRVVGSYLVEGIIFHRNSSSDGAYMFGREIITKAREIEAKAIISLGTMDDVRGIRIKSGATSWSRDQEMFVSKPALAIELESWDIAKIMADLDAIGFAYESEISSDFRKDCCNALMFRTLKAMRNLWCTIPYIFLYLPYTAAAVEYNPSFGEKRYLTSLPEIAKILAIFMDGLRAG